MNLSEQQRRFLGAAKLASWRQSQIFRPAMVCEWLGLGGTECDEIIRWLVKDGLIVVLTDDEAMLTAAGGELAATVKDFDRGHPPHN